MPDTFGGRLREHREHRQVPLATIADATKINITLLEALERDDVSRWPGGIFRRAFMRAYADAIGLNADAIVREFLELHPDPFERLPLMGADHGTNGEAVDDEATGFWRVLGTPLRAVRRSRSSNGTDATSLQAVGRPAASSVPLAVSFSPKTMSSRNFATAESSDRAKSSPSRSIATSAFAIASSSSEAMADSSCEAVADAGSGVPRSQGVDTPTASFGEMPESSRGEIATSACGEAAVVSSVSEQPPTSSFEARATSSSAAAMTSPSPATVASSREAMPAATAETFKWADAAVLCTQLAQAHGEVDAAPLLAATRQLLGARGIILWVWEPQIGALRAALVYGYSTHVVSQLPLVHRDDDNATAVAFEHGRMCIVSGGNGANGGLALPVFGPAGCTGVLALELADGGERREPIQALATILAAQMNGLIEATRTGQVVLAERRRA